MIFNPQMVNVWVGLFSSKERFDAYFGKIDDGDESTALCEMTQDIDDFSYGRNMFQKSFYEIPTVNIEDLLRQHRLAESTVEQVSLVFARTPKLFNTVLVMWTQGDCSQIRSPLTIRKEGVYLRYLGCFDDKMRQQKSR